MKSKVSASCAQAGRCHGRGGTASPIECPRHIATTATMDRRAHLDEQQHSHHAREGRRERHLAHALVGWELGERGGVSAGRRAIERERRRAKRAARAVLTRGRQRLEQRRYAVGTCRRVDESLEAGEREDDALAAHLCEKIERLLRVLRARAPSRQQPLHHGVVPFADRKRAERLLELRAAGFCERAAAVVCSRQRCPRAPMRRARRQLRPRGPAGGGEPDREETAEMHRSDDDAG